MVAAFLAHDGEFGEIGFWRAGVSENQALKTQLAQGWGWDPRPHVIPLSPPLQHWGMTVSSEGMRVGYLMA